MPLGSTRARQKSQTMNPSAVLLPALGAPLTVHCAPTPLSTSVALDTLGHRNLMCAANLSSLTSTPQWAHFAMPLPFGITAFLSCYVMPFSGTQHLGECRYLGAAGRVIEYGVKDAPVEGPVQQRVVEKRAVGILHYDDNSCRKRAAGRASTVASEALGGSSWCDWNMSLRAPWQNSFSLHGIGELTSAS